MRGKRCGRRAAAFVPLAAWLWLGCSGVDAPPAATPEPEPDWAELLASVDPRSLDTSCSARMHRQPFILDGAALRAYLADELVPMIG